MSKELKDYLHLYLGCEVLCESQSDSREPNIKTLTGLSYDDTQRQWWCYFENDETSYLEIEFLRPILSHLSDMTEEERKEVEFSVTPSGYKYSPKTFFWLLSKQFDLFGLIESGLAIDKKTLNLQP